MLATRVACPQCQALLKSAHAVPAGKSVKCPRCGFAFRVPSENGLADVSAAANSFPEVLIVEEVLPVAVPVGNYPQALPANTIQRPTPVAVMAGPRPVSLPPPAVIPVAVGAEGKGIDLARLAIALGGAFVFLVVGLSLAAYCFANNKKIEDVAESDSRPADEDDEYTPPRPRPQVRRSAVPPEVQAKINEATGRGVNFLKTSQQANGSWSGSHPVGYASLPALTLLECGVPAEDATVQKAADFVRKNTSNLNSTYDLSLAILFLDRLGELKDHELIQTLALRLVAGQTITGGWGYNCSVLNASDQKRFHKILGDLQKQSRMNLKKYQPLPGEPAVPPALANLPVLQDLAALKDDSFKNFVGDNSNSQFAILALWAARRHDVPVERTVALVVKRYRNSQRPDGSWSYQPQGNVSQLPTMTCAGLLGLAVGLGLESDIKGNENNPDKDPAIQKAFQLLEKHIGEPTKRPAKEIKITNLYYLWSIERVGVLFDRRTFGKKDWYAWGLEMLLARQEANGSWNANNNPDQHARYPGHNPVIDTCFSLLFLKQANLAKDLTSKLRLRG